jgi:branched-chain amino acid transport system ATP-binding protein
MASPALEVQGLHAGYGSAEVLFGIDLVVGAGEVLALMGRNGMGKSTLIRTVLGLTAITAGTIRVAGRDVTGWPSYRVARSGVGWVPEGRQVFNALSVEENLLVAGRSSASDGAWTLQSVYALFPRLAERKRHFGNQLSGGEQQMLAVGRALLTQPAILILDEATEGLAPLVREEIWRTVAVLKSRGQTVLIVDRDLDALSRLADRYAVLEKGRIAHCGSGAELATQRSAIERFVGV